MWYSYSTMHTFSAIISVETDSIPKQINKNNIVKGGGGYSHVNVRAQRQTAEQRSDWQLSRNLTTHDGRGTTGSAFRRGSLALPRSLRSVITTTPDQKQILLHHTGASDVCIYTSFPNTFHDAHMH